MGGIQYESDTMAENVKDLGAILNALYDIIQGLTLASSDEDFKAFGAFFAEDCTVYLKSMNLHRMPGVTRTEAIEDMKEVLEKVKIEKREILSSSTTANGLTLFCETKQRINVMGDTLDPFFETEIATFNEEGLITELKMYSCWSPIVTIVQNKTGVGPMAEGERREEWDKMVKRMVQKKMQKRAERAETICCT